MKYFIDTEFIEGFHRPLFGRCRHFIDLISIGLVAEDGRQYYAISNEFDIKKAWKNEWLKENVLKPLWQELMYRDYREHANEYKKEAFNILDALPEKQRVSFYVKNILLHEIEKFDMLCFKGLIKKHGKSNKEISTEIIEFVNPDLYWPVYSYSNSELKPGNGHPLSKHFDKHNVGVFRIEYEKPMKGFDDYYCAQPEFYGYYADYDWVLFCSLFGRMMDLPKGFPMYCRDLKQEFDELAKALYNDKEPDSTYKGMSLPEIAEKMKSAINYPKQTNEHNALADAKWNLELYKFLQ